MKNEIYCCNFCGRSSQEARKMIGSPNGECFICDSCIKYCSNLLNHDQIENTKKELQKIQNEIIAYGCILGETLYTDKVTVKCFVPYHITDFSEKLTDTTNGKVKINKHNEGRFVDVN